jgi:hypothetical protein
MSKSLHYAIDSEPAVSKATSDRTEIVLKDTDDDRGLQTESGGAECAKANDRTSTRSHDNDARKLSNEGNFCRATSATFTIKNEGEAQLKVPDSNPSYEIASQHFDTDDSGVKSDCVSSSTVLDETIIVTTQSIFKHVSDEQPLVDSFVSTEDHDGTISNRIFEVTTENATTQEIKLDEYSDDGLQPPPSENLKEDSDGRSQNDSKHVDRLPPNHSRDGMFSESDALDELKCFTLPNLLNDNHHNDTQSPANAENFYLFDTDRNAVNDECSESLSTSYYSCLGESSENGRSENESSNLSFRTAMILGNESMEREIMEKGSTYIRSESDFLTCREHDESSSQIFDITSHMDDQSTNDLSHSFCSYYTCANILSVVATKEGVSTNTGAVEENQRKNRPMHWPNLVVGVTFLIVLPLAAGVFFTIRRKDPEAYVPKIQNETNGNAFREIRSDAPSESPLVLRTGNFSELSQYPSASPTKPMDRNIFLLRGPPKKKKKPP